jgi:Zn-dependent protease with chaperone function
VPGYRRASGGDCRAAWLRDGGCQALGQVAHRTKARLNSRRVPLPVKRAVSHLCIEKPFTGFSMQNLFSTHPPTAERVARLREMARRRFQSTPVAGRRAT